MQKPTVLLLLNSRDSQLETSFHVAQAASSFGEQLLATFQNKHMTVHVLKVISVQSKGQFFYADACICIYVTSHRTNSCLHMHAHGH